jgi:hypothetical protein
VAELSIAANKHSTIPNTNLRMKEIPLQFERARKE